MIFEVSAVSKNFNSVDSFANLGLYRFTDEEFPDRLSEITNLSLGTDAQAGIIEYIDYMEEPDLVVDWATATSGAEDWGPDFPSSNVFGITVTGTLDGHTTFGTNQIVPLAEFIDEKAIFYSLTASGIYHIVGVTALGLNESFHIKTAEISGFLGGRL